MKDLGVTDLIAAFDVMIHTMLLKKMEDLDVRGWTMQVIAMNYFKKWLQMYVSLMIEQTI